MINIDQMNTSSQKTNADSSRFVMNKKSRMLRYLGVFLSVFVIGSVSIAGLNRFLDPLNFGGTGRTDAIQALVHGQNVAIPISTSAVCAASMSKQCARPQM